MSLSDIGDQTCSVARAIALVGDAWSLMIVRELFLGSRRYDELRAYTGISPHLLSLRLRALESGEVIERRVYQQRPPRHEYHLTPKGLDLWPVINALRRWGDRWNDWPEGVPLRVRHRGCRHDVMVHVDCPSCGQTVGPDDVEGRLSPAARAARAAHQPAAAAAPPVRKRTRQ